jgi:hypothetical protein
MLRKEEIAAKVEAARRVDIREYMGERGFEFNARGFCRSPFKRDTNWSFKYYPNTNSFFDWSKGFGGDTIRLVMNMENVGFLDAVDILTRGSYKPYVANYKSIPKPSEPFTTEKFINTNNRECLLIKEYAESRSIRRGYEYGVFFTRDSSDRNWVRNPSVMFVLKDEHLQPCGVKFRKIGVTDGERFSSRGKMGFYILENILTDTYDDPILFLIESETSANSLWEYCCKIRKSAIVLSFGSVSNVKFELPVPYRNIKDKRLIIDYDGSEELYQQRVKNFEYLGVRPLKLILDKGEDINSLYSSKQMYKINNLLFNGKD